MASIDIRRLYADGEILLASDLDAIVDDVESFLNITKINDDNIQTGGIDASLKLADATIITAKIANNAVTTAKINAEAVTTAKIADANVTLAKMATDSVNTSQIVDAAVTPAKLSSLSQSFLVPTGAVMAFAGTTSPVGWLLCDGAEVSRTTYADLFALLGESHGEGDTALTFNLPDYRGRFLRGVDDPTGADPAGRDPDAASRTAMSVGGNTGGLIGSTQDEGFISHGHQIRHRQPWPPGSPVDQNGRTLVAFIQEDIPSNLMDSATYLVPGSTTAEPTGGNETRPKNAYVNFIIKY
jgi:hypothetical protein